jgi:hypothetical protein
MASPCRQMRPLGSSVTSARSRPLPHSQQSVRRHLEVSSPARRLRQPQRKSITEQTTRRMVPCRVPSQSNCGKLTSSISYLISITAGASNLGANATATFPSSASVGSAASIKTSSGTAESVRKESSVLLNEAAAILLGVAALFAL